MISYRGFDFIFDDLSYRLRVWSSDLEISFTIGLTDVQCLSLIKLGGNNYPKECLVNTMKRHINGYLKYIEEQNEHNKCKI